MILRFVFFVAVCVAQGFSEPDYTFDSLLRGSKMCKNPNALMPYKLSEALIQIDEMREIVSSTATDAYFRGKNVGAVITCFTDEASAYIELGEEISIMIENTSLDVMETLKGKLQKYAKLLAEPLHIIGETIRELPGRVVKLITHMHFLKAYKAVREARRIIDENARRVGKIVESLSREVPELGVKIHNVIDRIYITAKNRSESIKKSYYECILNHK